MKETDGKGAQQGQIQLDIDNETAQGRYANLALLSHSETEFVLDFIFLQPQGPTGRAKVHTRILSSPAHTKRLAQALAENIKRYEGRFGKIEPAGPPGKGIGFN